LFVKSASVANMIMALATLLAWPVVASVLAEPLASATDLSLGKFSNPGTFDLPFVLIWGMPVGATIFAWLLCNAGAWQLARFIAAYPVALFATSWAWFHFLRISLLPA